MGSFAVVDRNQNALVHGVLTENRYLQPESSKIGTMRVEKLQRTLIHS